MTYQQDLEDLVRHEAEIAAHESFKYAFLDDGETALLGCVYSDPPEKAAADSEICWWIVDDRLGTGLQDALDPLVPRWIADAWPFERPRYIGRDLSWPDWLALPDVTDPVLMPAGVPWRHRVAGSIEVSKPSFRRGSASGTGHARRVHRSSASG